MQSFMQISCFDIKSHKVTKSDKKCVDNFNNFFLPKKSLKNMV